MPPDPNHNREAVLWLIESRPRIHDRYVNIQRIDPNGGNGTFSLVFSAFDEVTRQEVVLKFFNPNSFTNLNRLTRFKREGEILLKLRGKPNILQCIDGVCNVTMDFTAQPGINIAFDFPFIPLEKARGDMEQFIYSGLSTPEKSLIYFREMCKAVARIHALK